MALIFCPECGNQVSEQAIQCVKCAYPIKNRNSNHADNTKYFNDSETLNNIEVSNAIVWLLAFVPFIGAFSQGLVYGFITSLTHKYYDFNSFWWVICLINIMLIFADNKNLKNIGIDTKKIFTFWAVLIVPIYLYNRATQLNHKQSYFWVWVITFFVSILL